MADDPSLATPSNSEVEKALSVEAAPSSTPHVQDRGPRAWSTLLGGFLVFMATFGYTNAFGVFQDYYTRSHTSSASNISWIGSVQLFLIIFLGLPAGKLLDAGYFRSTTLVGSVLFTFSLFMLSIANTSSYYQLFLSQGVGMGIGGGLLYVPALAIQAHHWHVHRPLAVGVVVAGASVGGIIFPVILNRLINGSLGFAWGVRVTAFIVLGSLAAANVLMSSNPAVTSRQGGTPPNIRAMFFDIPYVLVVFGALVILWGVYFPLFYLQLFAVERGISSNIAFYTLVILNATSIPGRLFPNMLVPRVGVLNLTALFCFVCGAIMFSMFGLHDAGGVIAFCVVYGFLSGAFLSLISHAVGALAKDESEIGIRVGLGYTVASIGALTGNPIDGALLGVDLSWNKAIIFSSVTTMGGACIIFAGRTLLARKKGTQFV